MNTISKLAEFESPLLKTLPDCRVGDSVRVHYRIVEGDKDRVQVSALLRTRIGDGRSCARRLRRPSLGLDGRMAAGELDSKSWLTTPPLRTRRLTQTPRLRTRR